MDKPEIRIKLSRVWRDRRGVAAPLLVIMMIALLGVVAVTIDVGRLMAIRSELQTAVDAAALAGAIELAGGGGENARTVAIDYANRNRAETDPVVVTPEAITFGTWDPVTSTFNPLPSAVGANALDVWARKDVGNWLAWALNIFGASAAAAATSWSEAPVGESACVKPWAIPEELMDINNDNTVETWEVDAAIGTEFTLKSAIGGNADSLDASGMPSFFYPVILPPFYDASTGVYQTVQGGAAIYKENIGTCLPDPIGVGDSLRTEPGNMPGPTVQGARDMCGEVIGTYCNPYGTYSPDGQPGMPMIAGFWDSDVDPIGRTAVVVATLGAFRLTRVYSQAQHGVVVGRFEELLDGGGIGTGATTLVRPILVR